MTWNKHIIEVHVSKLQQLSRTGCCISRDAVWFVSLEKRPVSRDKHLASLESPLESRFLLEKWVYFALDESRFCLASLIFCEINVPSINCKYKGLNGWDWSAQKSWNRCISQSYVYSKYGIICQNCKQSALSNCINETSRLNIFRHFHVASC